VNFPRGGPRHSWALHNVDGPASIYRCRRCGVESRSIIGAGPKGGMVRHWRTKLSAGWLDSTVAPACNMMTGELGDFYRDAAHRFAVQETA